MLALFAAGATGPPPVPPPGPQQTLDPSLHTLSRVRQAAGSIAERVRRALTPDGFVPVRVLVVDDHPDAADALAAVLELLGREVRASSAARSALSAAGAAGRAVA